MGTRRLEYKRPTSFIKENSLEWGIQVDVVNGMLDHLHVLFKLPITMSVAETIKQMKGSSSRWVNENYYPSGKFEWQQDYGVFSISMNEVNRIRNYIYNQELHHLNRSFQDEVKEFDIRKM